MVDLTGSHSDFGAMHAVVHFVVARGTDGRHIAPHRRRWLLEKASGAALLLYLGRAGVAP
jgi:hypothetical protein